MEKTPFRAALGDRSLFPKLQARAYLNHGAISPPSLAVMAAMSETMERFASDGVNAFRFFLEARDELRGEIADFIGAQKDEIAFVPNTSSGVLASALCFPFEDGDKILCFEGEFPTNVTPWQRAAALYGCEVRFHDAWEFSSDLGRALERLEATLRGGVRVVAVSAVQFQSGWRMPLGEMASLCQRFGTRLFVDGIQAFGLIPMDVAGIDFMSVGSHKWLMGPEGCAFVYVRREIQPTLRPVMASWLSHEEPLKFLFEGEGHLRYDRPIRSEISFLEFGAQNTPGQMGLGASLGLIRELGVETIFQHVGRYLDNLEEGLEGRGFTSLRARSAEGRSGILSLRSPPTTSNVSVAGALNARGIACTSPDGLLRFAPHWPNALSEVSIVLDAIDEALRELSGGV